MAIETGVDRLIREEAGAKAEGRGRIALATNPSAVTGRGVPTWKALMDSGFSLAAFFGPEHGFRGDAQDAVEIADGSFRGIPSYSLYGARLEPEERMLKGIDLVVYDIQDVGCRYYTYLYTLANIARVCERAGLPLLVLDRPDPIGGVEVEGGPIADSAASFVGGYRLPPRYGMTVGEFARYLQGEFFPRLRLEVERLGGWDRRDFFDRAGLPWVSPSPNIPSLATALVYPGTCLFEGTNVSEGRGSTRPFETVGAPWIDGEELREDLASLALPGLVFAPAAFTPNASKHSGAFCGGVSITVTEPEKFKPLLTGLALLKTVHDKYPESFGWKATWEDSQVFFVDRLAGGPELRAWIDGGLPLEEIYARLSRGREDFLARRRLYLLY